MKRFLLRLSIILALIFLIDRVAGLALAYLYRHSDTTDEYKISESVEGTTADLLFMGSSRCMHHYDARIYQDSLGITAFNAGDWGIKNIYFQYGLLCNILERYTPAYIVLEIHPSDYLNTPYSGVERVGSLAPYVGKSEECDSILKKAGLYWSYRFSHIYRYVGAFPTMLAGSFVNQFDRSRGGLKPLSGVMDTTNIKAEEFPFEPDSARIDCLLKFVCKCKTHHIKLAFIESPMYVCTTEPVFSIPQSIADENGIPFFNNFTDSAFVGHHLYFHDFGHLNEIGAIAYSKHTVRQVRSLLK